jgi:homoserine acetyltransferase
LIYGYSMGAMQALQWGCLHPTRVQRIAAVSEQQQQQQQQQQHPPELHTEIERAVMQ